MNLQVIYVGQLWQGSTCLERAKVLVECGWNLLQFDVTPYHSGGSRFSRSVQHRLLWGPNVKEFNRDLVDFVRRNGSAQAVWIDKGQWVFPSTLKEIKTCTGALLVHYTPDPAFSVHTSRHFKRSLSLYDLCITTKRYELERYREAGAKQVIFTWQGIDDRFIHCERCAEIEGTYRAGIVFIGHTEPHYRRVLTSVGSKHQTLEIYGPGWQRAASRDGSLRFFVKGGPLWDRDYVRCLANARIGLGLLSKYCQDEFTTRSFEIPAAGTMLIAERTEEHQDLFEEGKEAEFFATLEELSDKISFYLKNDQARCRIAEKGRLKTLSCYHWKHVLVPVVEVVEGIRTGHR